MLVQQWMIGSAAFLGLVSFPSDNPQVCSVEPGFAYHLSGNAGCMVFSEEKMLVVRMKKKGTLSFPGGRPERGEVAQCTAYRETFEEAGLRVRVGRLLYDFGGQFYLFECHTDEVTKNDSLGVPLSGRDEVSEVLWVDPRKIRKRDWRFPAQLPLVKKLGKKVSGYF